MQGKLETRVGLFVLAAIAVFVYMGLQIGAFRFDLGNYNPYIVYFSDVSGLSRKAIVKIAGVDVGWVDSLSLVREGDQRVKVRLMVLKEYPIHEDAAAIVRRDGFFGSQYVEVFSGSADSPRLRSGGTLGQPSRDPVKVDELMRNFEGIARDVQEVSDSFKAAFGGDTGKERIENLVQDVADTARRMSDFSHMLEERVTSNGEKVESLLEIGQEVKKVASRLDEKTLPTFERSVDQVANAVDQDFERVADQFELTAISFKDTSGQVYDSFRSIEEIADKINHGDGLIGRLINEDDLYKDLKYAAGSLKNYFGRAERIRLIFDAHTETMHRPAENFGKRNDSKAYLDLRVFLAEDYFLMVQLAASERGYYDRYQFRQGYWNENECLVNPAALNLTDAEKLELAYTKNLQIVQRMQWRVGIQLGKSFGALRFRIGLMDGYGGIGADCDIPFPNRNLRWITTFEAYDFNGWNRENDFRPHFKWFNRIFAMDNLYFVFGADDFVSKRNANIFAGLGLRFGDDDLKYLLPMAGGSGATSLLAERNNEVIPAITINS